MELENVRDRRLVILRYEPDLTDQMPGSLRKSKETIEEILLIIRSWSSILYPGK